jgi:hypothetical protein
LAVNPISGRPEIPSVDRLESFNTDVQEIVDVPIVSMPLEKILDSAENAKWVKEAASYPGGIHCLNVVHKLPTGSILEFFAHGFDRNGKFIAGSIPGTIHLIAFSNGKQNFPALPTPAKAGRPPKLCIVQLPNSNTPIWLLHYFTPILCLMLAAIFFMAGKVSQAQGERGGSTGSTATRIGFVLLVIASLWVVSYFIP